MGHVHHTGVSGMVLAATSGIGFLSRVYGLTAGHLVAVTMVTSSGDVVEAREDHNTDLLWGKFTY